VTCTSHYPHACQAETSPRAISEDNLFGTDPKQTETVAARLGLNYDKIGAEMERLQEYRQQITAQPLKGHSVDGTSKKISKTSA
jgi:hypothetical protein